MDSEDNKNLLTYLENDDVNSLKKLHQKNPEIFLTKVKLIEQYAVHVAAKHNALNCMEYILKNRISPDIAGFGLSIYPLHIAAKNLNLEMTQLLLQYGANPNVKVFTECTPLIILAEKRGCEETKIKIARELIECGANPCLYGSFMRGLYGTNPYNGEYDPFIGLSASYFAKYYGENKLYEYLKQEQGKWNEAHTFKNRALKFLGAFGQLIGGQKNENTEISKKPQPEYFEILPKNPDGTINYNGRINEIISNIQQRQ